MISPIVAPDPLNLGRETWLERLLKGIIIY